MRKMPKAMSQQLADLLDRKRTGPMKPTNQFGWAIDTTTQRKLCTVANRMLRKAKFFEKHDRFDAIPVECIAANSSLRPLWHGTV